MVRYAVGLRHCAGYRVSTSSSPNRLVVDVDAFPAVTEDLAIGRFLTVDDTGALRWQRRRL